MAPSFPPPISPLSSQGNIFPSPFRGAKETDPALQKRKIRWAQLKVAVTAVALAAYSFFFFYPQMKAYLAFPAQIKGIQGQIAQYDASLEDLKKKRELHKAAYDAEFTEEQKIINTVFPESVDKLGVIRLMENFATNLNAAYPPFEFNAVSFQEPVKSKGYTMLPFQTTIRTSRANFDRFLELVRLSGNVDPKSPDHLRLMDISTVSLRYLGTDSNGKDLGVDFSVQMNAYSR